MKSVVEISGFSHFSSFNMLGEKTDTTKEKHKPARG
jgi:hypothetical protein